MAQYANRSELESQAKLLGYEPDRDDTDADLIVAINMRSSGTARNSIGDDHAHSHAIFSSASATRGS